MAVQDLKQRTVSDFPDDPITPSLSEILHDIHEAISQQLIGGAKLCEGQQRYMLGDLQARLRQILLAQSDPGCLCNVQIAILSRDLKTLRTSSIDQLKQFDLKYTSLAKSE